jgi:hypothetical protein
LENTPYWQARQSKGNWAQVHDFQPAHEDQRINLCQMEMTLRQPGG